MNTKERIAILICIMIVAVSVLSASFFFRSFISSEFNWNSLILYCLIPDTNPASLSTSIFVESRWLYLFFAVWGSAGLFVFYNSGYRKRALLQFMLAFLALKFFLFILFMLVSIAYNILFADGFWTMLGFDKYENGPYYGLEEVKNRTVITLTVYLFSYLFWGIVCTFAYRALSARRVIRLDVWGVGELQQQTYTEADKSTRFLHNLVDQLLIIWFILTMLSGFIGFFLEETLNSTKRLLNTAEGYLTLTYVVMLFYYPLTEILFRQSPAKIFTNSIVADKNGNHPGVGRILLRSLCRFIPFNAVSFFGERGWHDQFSGTYVLKTEIPDPQKNLLEFDFADRNETTG